MEIVRLGIEGTLEIIPHRHEDARGYFAETYRRDWFTENVAPVDFVQDNQSLSCNAGVLRGLHFQSQPSPQGKLVRCIAGAVFDVAVDIRHGSSSFGRWVAATLTADLGNQLWVPAGFMHGFCTLTPGTIVCYKVTHHYNAAADKGVVWDDPDIGVRWPDIAKTSLMSPKDRNLPRLRDLGTKYFSYPSGSD